VSRPAERPYVLLSCAMSLDGHIDDATDMRLLLSNDADLDRVHRVRAGCDAILVGAGTIRSDNPSLLVRHEDRDPVKITITGTGELDPDARFFTTGDCAKIVYAVTSAAEKARVRVGQVATVVDAGEPLDLPGLLADLAGRGVRRLMVEGGTRTHTLFLTAGLADELQLAVAPFFVGEPRAPRFVRGGRFPWDATRRAALAEVARVGDVALLRYALSDRFTR
jgi:5-amino-6-(5-phosphoribosylamino)uracil reductase